jgi:DNA gyrase subunit B
VFLGREQHWFADQAERDQFIVDASKKLGHELKVAESHSSAPGKGAAGAGDGTDGSAAATSSKPEESNGHEPALQVFDLHEVKAINHGLEKLAGYGIKVRDLLPAGTKNGAPVYPFLLQSEDEQVPLSSLRELLVALRKLGEKGLKLTRFKGLGEMNSDELGETSMAENGSDAGVAPHPIFGNSNPLRYSRPIRAAAGWLSTIVSLAPSNLTTD